MSEFERPPIRVRGRAERKPNGNGWCFWVEVILLPGTPKQEFYDLQSDPNVTYFSKKHAIEAMKKLAADIVASVSKASGEKIRILDLGNPGAV